MVSFPGVLFNCYYLCNRDLRIQVNVLDGVKQFDAIFHGTLECFTSADQAHAAGTLVDDSSDDGFFQVGGTV